MAVARRPVRAAVRGSLGAAAAAGAMLFAGASAHAALFEDTEARKAIIDLRGRVTQTDEKAAERAAQLAATHAQLVEQLAGVRRSLLELSNQIESMRGEIARLRGNDEQLGRDVADLQKRQADIGQSLDERLARLEPTKVALDGREFAATPNEKASYDSAIAAIRGGDFDKAVDQLSAFQRRHPASGYVDSVRFWLGNALYGKREYARAIDAFRAFVAGAPTHPRIPEALLATANSQAEMKDVKAARRTLEELVKSYPQTEAAQAGRERLAALK